MNLKTNKFTILLDDPTNDQLIGLSHERSMSKGAFIRQLINASATMTYGRQPTCADGQRCSCPQMHAYTPPAAPAQPPPIPQDPDTLPRTLAPFPVPQPYAGPRPAAEHPDAPKNHDL